MLSNHELLLEVDMNLVFSSLIVNSNVMVEKLSFLVKCFVAASMKKDKYPVVIHLCQESGDVLYARCTCKAGKGGCCKHVAAVLYQLVEYRTLKLRTVPDDKTCTDILQKWHVPGESSNEQPIKFADLTFYKANLKKDINSSRKRPLVTGNREFCASPLFSHFPKVEKLKKLSEDLLNAGEGVVLGKLLKNNYDPCTFFQTSISEYQARKEATASSTITRSVVSNIFERIGSNLPQLSKLTESQRKFIKDYVMVDKEQSIAIEASTLNQSSSDRWFEERKKRITASNFGAVINRRVTMYPNALLKKLFQTSKFKSKHCDWGTENEKVALKKYVERFTDCSLADCGFIVNPTFPWLGASPDGIISRGGEVFVIEVKCPSMKRDMSIKESCNDKNFCLMTDKNNCPKLKRKHPYYFQCQGLMAITETVKMDFIVFTNIDMHIETILFDKLHWEGCYLPRLTDFYFKFMMDRILQK